MDAHKTFKVLCGSLNLESFMWKFSNIRRKKGVVGVGMRMRSLRFGTQQWANIDSILLACTLSYQQDQQQCSATSPDPSDNYLLMLSTLFSRNDFQYRPFLGKPLQIRATSQIRAHGIRRGAPRTGQQHQNKVIIFKRTLLMEFELVSVVSLFGTCGSSHRLMPRIPLLLGSIR